MRQFNRFCAGLVLMLALSIPAFAGHISCGGFTEDPPPPQETSDGVLQVAVTLLQGVLSAF